MRELVGIAVLMFGMVGLASPVTGAQGPSEPGPPDASWARLVGHVLDATGRPAAGIRSVLQCNWLDGRWGRLEATTDANGQMTIGTPPGQCTLVVNAPRGLSFQGPGLRLFEFAPGETVEVTRHLETYAFPPPIEGRVLDDSGQGVSGARVILRSHTNHAGAQQ